MGTSMARKRQLKVLLLKSAISDFRDAVREDSRHTEHVLRPDLPFEGLFLLKTTSANTPSWTDLIAPALQEPLPRISTLTSGALLLLRVEERMLALTFGYGRSLLRPDAYERDFGLRVVLNTVDPESIRSVDMRTMEDITLLTRRQASRASDFGVFGLDSSQDLLRGVTGIPRDGEFASRIAGAEALTLATEVDVDSLHDKCRQMLRAYASEQYKDRFAFIDYLCLVRDPALLSVLERKLLDDLESNSTDRMHLAPPEPQDWENIEGFTYGNRRNPDVHLDLDVEDALSEMAPRTGFSIQYLRTKPVGVRYREAGESDEKYTFFSCLVYEVEVEDRLYVLSGGDWHEIDKDWADQIRTRVSQIPAASVDLPLSSPGEWEAEYNSRVADEMGWALMDRRIISLAPPHDRVEMCDLLTEDHQLIHVKRKTESATLSHLFAQGAVSAELLFRSEEFREKCRAKASEGDPRWAEFVPLEKPNPVDYEVVYAVIARTRSNWPRSLPFFSQLNLDNTAAALRSLGYRVSLTHVAADPA
jgi:uncharacterized protein (TIGR04141 family)